jgi:hypothetical protein
MQSDCPYAYTTAFVSYFAIGIVGFVALLLTIVVQIKDPFLRKCPGEVLLPKLLFQMLFHLHFISGWPFLYK